MERIRAYCLWDNDNCPNMTNPWDVDSGAYAGHNAGQNIRIAVIDSGVDYYTDNQGIHYHPDLAANIAGGMCFYYNRAMGVVQMLSDYRDIDGHGTEIIGIIAAVVNGLGANQSGIIGVAPETRIYALKTYSWDPREVAAAINYSVDVLGVQIINLSLGFHSSS